MTYAERMKLNRLFKIRDLQKKLHEEKMELMLEIGYGTHRSKDFPGMKLMVQRAGWSTHVSWLYVARELAAKLKMSREKLKEIAESHRTRTNRNKRVVITIDTAKNPKVLPV